MHKELISYKPEQVFLIQGDINTFNSFIENAQKDISNLENYSLSRFTTEDARKIVSFNIERPPESWCLIYFDVFVPDAAEVLLKTLEEPSEGVYIVFITPHPYLIPQTIRSRARLIPNVLSLETPSYLSSKKSALEYIKENFSSESEEDASVRRAKATVFLDALEQHVRTSPDKSNVVYEAKDMLFKANMPTKQVVEYVIAMIY